MAAVIDFPEQGHRQWMIFERVVREQTAALYSPDEISAALEGIKPVFLRCAATKLVGRPATGEEALERINGWVSRVVSGMLLEVLSREIQLARLRGTAP